jgi:hypothetical protein
MGPSVQRPPGGAPVDEGGYVSADVYPLSTNTVPAASLMRQFASRTALSWISAMCKMGRIPWSQVAGAPGVAHNGCLKFALADVAHGIQKLFHGFLGLLVAVPVHLHDEPVHGREHY